MPGTRPKRSASDAVSYCEVDEEEEMLITEEAVEELQQVESDDILLDSDNEVPQNAEQKQSKRSRLSKGSANESLLGVSISSSNHSRRGRVADENDGDYEDQAEDDENSPKKKSSKKTSKKRDRKPSKSSSRSKRSEKPEPVGVRRSSRGVAETLTPGALVDVASDSSDDEFAREHFILPSDSSDDEDRGSRRKQRKCRPRSEEDDREAEDEQNSGSDSDSDSNKEEFRVQHLLARRCLVPSQWRQVCEHMTTREITRGSFFIQPDEEFFSDSFVQVEKFLVKWVHASYLHVSWETEKDIIEQTGGAGKAQLKKFRIREALGQDLFDDLGPGEFFLPSFVQVDRILDLDDEKINIQTVDWARAPVPPLEECLDEIAESVPEQEEQALVEGAAELEVEGTASEAQDATVEAEAEVEAEVQDAEAETEAVGALRTRGSKKAAAPKKTKYTKGVRKGKEPDFPYLHSSECYVTVKWENMPYSDSTLEKLEDLRRCGIEYEPQMRNFYRREQLPPAKGTSRVKRTLDESVMDSAGPVLPMGRELRDYQWEGVRWMLFNWSQRRNSILADEMGLGKTIQSSVFLQMLRREQGMRGPFLVVAPLSTVVQWQREVTTWTDMDAIIYHGSLEDREIIRTHELSYLSRGKGADGYKLEVVITTPETCMAADNAGNKNAPNARIKRELSKIQWDCIIIDEAHKLKNYDSKMSAVLRDEYSYLNCLLLTGTPLQNNTDELWTLLNFVAREEFSNRGAFKKDFGDLKTSAQLDKLHTRLKPYLLRREKELVEKAMPPKEEVVIEVELTVPQKQYYRAIYEQKTGFLYKGGAKDGPSLSNLAMELRKCCNHPFLVKGAEIEIGKHFVGDSPNEILIKSSGKMTLLDKLLPKLQADGHRVLIFSQFRIMLNIIEDYLIYKGFSFDRVDGTITGRKRQAAVDRYSAPDSKIFAMLLSTRAGGVGINLTSADTVIIFDSDWNPQNDIQAQARAHRIGQTKPVKVYRLLTTKTYEMAMFQAASIKLGLDYAVMNGMQGAAPGLAGISDDKAEHFSAMSKRELENLLKHGAYDVFNEERSARGIEDSKRFCEDDIDAILQRSAKVLHDAKAAEKPKLVSSSFSKASFVAGETGNDVQIDDPNFWAKVVGLSEGADQQIEKKRKCRTENINYKEPTNMTFRIVQEADGDDGDSDNSDDCARGKRAKTGNVTADWSEGSLTRVLLAMVAHGYGNWGAIRNASKLRWSHGEIAKACRYTLLQVLFWASLGDKPNEQIWGGASCPEGIEAAQWGLEDLAFVEAHLTKHRVCRLAFCALDRESGVDSSELPVEDNLLRAAFDYAAASGADQFAFFDGEHGMSELSAAHFTTPAPVAPVAASSPSSAMDEVKGEKGEAEAATAMDECNDSAAASTAQPLVSDKYALLKAVMGKLRESELPTDFTFSWDDARKMRLSARSKLSQIEDLFELYLASGVARDGNFGYVSEVSVDKAASPSMSESPAAPSEPSAAVSQNDVEQAPTNASEQAPVTPAVNVPVSSIAGSVVNRAALERKLDAFGENLDPADGVDGWTHTLDAWLILAVNQVGWPEGKRKLSALEEMWAQQREDDWVRLPEDFFAGKFLAKRVKEIASALRGSKGKAALKAAQNAEAAAAAESKAAAAAAAKSKKMRHAVFKAVEKLGRPRQCYAAMIAQLKNEADALAEIDPEQEQADGVDLSVAERIKVFLTYEMLAEECGMPTDDVQSLRDLVEALAKIGNADPEDPSKPEIVEGPMAGMAYKALVACCEKNDVMHQVRMALGALSSMELRTVIGENCKGAGPNTPMARRDTELPVWWTADHDIHLLRLVLVNGLGQWKKLIAEKPISDAPAGFEMPARIQGIY